MLCMRVARLRRAPSLAPTHFFSGGALPVWPSEQASPHPKRFVAPAL